MAIVQNPITGRSRKKFGTAVFSKQFGKNTMRTKPISVKNPKSIGQSTQRKKFTTVVNLIRQVLQLINKAYAGSITNMSPFNKIVSLNVRNAFTGDPPVLDHSKVVLCDFEGSTVGSVVMTAEQNQTMNVEWDPNTVDPDELASMLTFILFNCSTNKAMIYPDVAPRSADHITFIVPQSWVGNMTALHILTKDYSQLLANKPRSIIKFKAGADAGSVVQ